MSKATPKHGTCYPLRIGKTLRHGSRHGSRSLLSLKFTHVPNNTQLRQPGCLTRRDDKCTVSLSTEDGQGVSFTGARSAKTTVTDFVLVFANGAMWLERADDVYPGMRPGRPAEGTEVPVGVGDDVRRDPDSWMAPESGSPITPEGNEGEEVRRSDGRIVSEGRTGGKSLAAKTLANKGLPNGNSHLAAQSSSEEDDSDNNSDSDDSDSDSSNEYTDRSSEEDD